MCSRSSPSCGKDWAGVLTSSLSYELARCQQPPLNFGCDFTKKLCAGYRVPHPKYVRLVQSAGQPAVLTDHTQQTNRVNGFVQLAQNPLSILVTPRFDGYGTTTGRHVCLQFWWRAQHHYLTWDQQPQSMLLISRIANSASRRPLLRLIGLRKNHRAEDLLNNYDQKDLWQTAYIEMRLAEDNSAPKLQFNAIATDSKSGIARTSPGVYDVDDLSAMPGKCPWTSIPVTGCSFEVSFLLTEVSLLRFDRRTTILLLKCN